MIVRMKNKLSLILFLFLSISLFMDNILALELDEARDALVNTAYAYKYRGKYFQYNDVKMTYNYSDKIVSRCDIAISPEDITPQDVKYSSCSPYIWNIYYDAFIKNDNVTHYEFSYKNKAGEKFVTTSSSRFILMANPYFNMNNTNHTNPYYDENIAVYNLAVKKKNSGNGNAYTEKIVYGGETEDYIGFSRTISNFQYSNGTYEKDNYVIVENIPGSSEVTKTFEYTDPASFRANIAQYALNKIIELAEPGDVIGYIYKSGNGSHVLIVVDVDKDNGTIHFLHSYNGANYSFDIKKDTFMEDGTVVLWSGTNLKNNTSYGLLRSDISQISIIRPLNSIVNHGYKLSTNAAARKDYSQLVRTKTASVNKYDSVNPGDMITYTYTLKNNASNQYTGISITDNVPTNTTYVTCSGCTKNGSKVSWNNIKIDGGDTKTYTFTVRVNKNISLGSEIVSNQSVVAGIKLNTITTAVNRTLPKSLQSKIIAKTNEKLGSNLSQVPMTIDSSGTIINITLGSKVSDSYYGRHLVQDIYNLLGEVDFNFKEQSTSNTLKSFYNVDTVNITASDEINEKISDINAGNYNRYTLKSGFSTNSFANMYIDGLYGGVYVDKAGYNQTNFTEAARTGSDGRNKTYRNDTLMVGDVLLLYDDDYLTETGCGDYNKDNNCYPIPVANTDAYNAYLYLGNGEFATVMKNNDKNYIAIIGNKTQNDASQNPSRLLSSLIGQNAFIILRPSYAMDNYRFNADSDINSDESVDIKDVRILANYVVNANSNYGLDKLLLGDNNYDGIIKTNDVVKLLKQISERT